jgi:hypothetical protein
LWVKSFGKKCRNTLIFKRLKWMRKNWKHRIVQRDAKKKMLWNSEHFFTNSKLYYSWKP